MMNKTILGMMLAVISVGIPSAAYAGDWSQYGVITQIEQQNDSLTPAVPGIYIQTDVPIFNWNCGTTPTQYFLADETAPSGANSKFKTDFAMIMAAYLNSRAVSFYVNACYNSNASWIETVRVR